MRGNGVVLLWIVSLMCIHIGSQASICLEIEKPKNRFETNHWFHMSEFYISKSGYFDNYFSNEKSVIFLAPSQKFVNGLTQMTFFLMLIGLTDGTIYKATVMFTNRHVHKIEPIGLQFEYIAPQHLGRDMPESLPDHIDRSKGYFFFKSSDSMNRNTAMSSEKEALTCTAIPNGNNSMNHAVVDGNNKLVYNWFESDAEVAALRFKVARICNPNGLHVGALPSDLIKSDLYIQYGLIRLRVTPQIEPTYIGNVTGAWDRMDQLRKQVSLIEAYKMRNNTLVNIEGGDYERIPDSVDTVTRTHNLLIYQRNGNRKFRYLDTQLDLLFTKLMKMDPGMGIGSGSWIESIASKKPHVNIEWNIDILVHSDETHPCDLYRLMHTTDILLTVHGFQEISLLFLRAGTTVVEWFPYRYFKPTYQLLAHSLNINSYYRTSKAPGSYAMELLRLVPSEEACMKHLRCRGYARSDDVVLTDNDVDYIIKRIMARSGLKYE